MDMDRDASGGVDKEEISALAIRLGAALTPAELDEAMREVAPLLPPLHGGFAICSQVIDGLRLAGSRSWLAAPALTLTRRAVGHRRGWGGGLSGVQELVGSPNAHMLSLLLSVSPVRICAACRWEDHKQKTSKFASAMSNRTWQTGSRSMRSPNH